VIQIEHLTKQFGNKTAVDDLNLEIPRGELFCFLGPNGAGKTTTIKILTGLMRATSGRARINGLDMRENPIEIKKQIGYIPDMPYLYDRLTAAEFFQFSGDLYDVPDDVVEREMEASFALFGLLEHRTALVRELSHGMRQRLIYATTFLHNPTVLFIDEPLVGLDPYTIRLIKDLLVQRTRNGTTIFLTTHILSVAQEIGDRIGIIAEGRLQALDTLDNLRTKHDEESLEDIFLQLTREGHPEAAGQARTA
jgi:ABC-2 type transport system ATP-binding protein